MDHFDRPGSFWHNAITFQRALSWQLRWRWLSSVPFATLLCGNGWIGHHSLGLELGLAPYEAAGAGMGLLWSCGPMSGYRAVVGGAQALGRDRQPVPPPGRRGAVPRTGRPAHSRAYMSPIPPEPAMPPEFDPVSGAAGGVGGCGACGCWPPVILAPMLG